MRWESLYSYGVKFLKDSVYQTSPKWDVFDRVIQQKIKRGVFKTVYFSDCSSPAVQDNATKTHHQSVSVVVVVSGDERTTTTNVTVSLASVVVSMPSRFLLFLTRYTTTQPTRQAPAFRLLVCTYDCLTANT